MEVTVDDELVTQRLKVLTDQRKSLQERHNSLRQQLVRWLNLFTVIHKSFIEKQ